MFKIEMAGYTHKLNSIETKYFSRLSATKLKTGIKIVKLEEKMHKESENYLSQINRLGMIIEDKESNEREINKIEETIILNSKENNQPTDLPSAVSKIKLLINARKIFEKNRAQDEKLIRGLTNKLQSLGLSYNEMQETNLKLNENSSSLAWCLGKLIEKSNLAEEAKNDVFQLLSSQNCLEIEEKFKEEKYFEDFSIESITKKFNDLKDNLLTISHAIKNETVKTKLLKLVKDSKIEENLITENKAIQRIKRSFAVSIKKNHNEKIVSAEGINKNYEESNLDSLKKVFHNIHQGIKAKNKIITDNLADLGNIDNYTLSINQSERDSLNLKSSKASKRKSAKKELIAIETETQTDPINNLQCSSTKEYKEIAQQTEQKKYKDSQNQTTYYREPKMLDKSQELNDFDNSSFDISHNTINQEKTLKADKSIQTDREIPRIDMNTPNSPIIKKLMRKTETSKTEILLRRHDGRAINLADNLIIKQIRNIGQKYKPDLFADELEEKKLENSEKIFEANDEYQKEFQIHSQMHGYKKLGFTDIQSLWEEVINRRIIDGENDKISEYLKEYIGSSKFDNEKARIIKLLIANRNNDYGINEFAANDFYAPCIKDFNNKMKIVQRWEGLLIKVMEKIVTNLAVDIFPEDSPQDILFKAAVRIKYIKHIMNKDRKIDKRILMKKSLTSSMFTKDKWSIKSTSPTLIKKNFIKSKYLLTKNNQTTDRIIRIKTPVKLNKSEWTTKLPYLGTQISK